MPNHPKVTGLSVHAKWSLIEFWCHAAQYRTDGHIADGVAKKIARPKVISELMDAGLVHRHDKGLVIHDWLDHNISAADAKQKRDDDAERLRKWREERDRKTGEA